MPVNFAVSIDLKRLVEELLIDRLIIIERMRVLGPCAHL